MAKAKPISNMDIQAPTAINARIIVKTRLEELSAWEPYVDNPYYIHELHNMRIAAKRLRYTLEIFAGNLPAAITPHLKEVELLQEELGALHDSDIMIALLRLCLGAVDAGSGYALALTHAGKTQKNADFAINPDMLAYLLDPANPPAVAERYGLETLLHDLHQQRNEHYSAFHSHWYSLKAKDFQQEVLTILDFQ